MRLAWILVINFRRRSFVACRKHKNCFRIWPGEGSTVQRKWYHVAPGCLKAPMLPDLLKSKLGPSGRERCVRCIPAKVRAGNSKAINYRGGAWGRSRGAKTSAVPKPRSVGSAEDSFSTTGLTEIIARQTLLHALLQKFVGELFFSTCRGIWREIWLSDRQNKGSNFGENFGAVFVREVVLGKSEWGLSNGSLWPLSAICAQSSTIVPFVCGLWGPISKGNSHHKMTTIVGNRGQLWTSTLSPH